MYPDFPCNNNKQRDFKGGDDRRDRNNNRRGGKYNDRGPRNDRNEERQQQPYNNHHASSGTNNGRANENSSALKKQSKMMEVRMATAEKEAIDKKAKLALNKITPDNYASIKTQVLEIYKSAETDEDKAAFVKVFFLKACHEEKYTDLYIDLIKYITNTVFKEKHGPKSTVKFSLLKEEFVESI